MMCYLVSAVFLICVERKGRGTLVSTVEKSILLHPQRTTVVALSLQFCYFDISPKVDLEKLIIVIGFSCPRACFPSDRGEVQPGVFRTMIFIP